MSENIYVIGKATYKDGRLKEIPSNWYMDYTIHLLEIGYGAVLLQHKGGLSLQTSRVEDIIYEEDGNIVIETRNTIYHLELKVGE